LGYRGTATAGENSLIALAWYDGTRRRLAVAYVGEDGIKPHTRYRVNDKGEFVEVA
jgi:hypothetical protein